MSDRAIRNSKQHTSFDYDVYTSFSSDIDPKGAVSGLLPREAVCLTSAGNLVVTKLDGNDETIPLERGDSISICFKTIKSTTTCGAVLVLR